MVKFRFLIGGLAVLISTVSFAQVVTLDPVFATQDDVVTITFNADLGNGALTGVVPVYMHSGVILEGESGWQNVQGEWGTPDNNVLMTPAGSNVHTKTININDFYGLQPGDVVEQLAFVFRNAGGTIVGRESDGSDIFVDIFSNDFAAVITAPLGNQLFENPPAGLAFSASTNQTADITLYLGGTELTAVEDGQEISNIVDFTGFENGTYLLRMEAISGSVTITDSVSVIIQGQPNVQNPPAGIVDGINYIDDSTVILQLFAPGKDFVYTIGDFTNWEFDLDYFMNVTTSGDRFWVQIDDLNPGQEYRFQYSIGQEDLRIADVYCEKILDPWNDPFISEETYPNLIDYPEGLTTEIVGILQTAQEPYDWVVVDFQRPPLEKLVIYELLVRDFVAAHDFSTIIDSLDYFKRLGVNAIELMPIQEFEGNESWGYNPMFYFAPDKYYGPKATVQEFVDRCHQEGIAVILDVVYNHSFGQNPQVRMYSENGPAGPPTSESPWFNVEAMHPFNVGYDYNHDSPHTQEFVERGLKHWVQEYKMDGFRFDLSKGFTQVFSSNVGAWNQFDQSRVDHWSRIQDEIHAYDDGVYLILEHLGDNPEETVLANNGFMLWGKMTDEFNEATMGYNSNLNWASYQVRNWQNPHLVSYAESHDEERLMVKNLQFGAQNAEHDTRDLNTALARMEAAAAFNILLPGPKMIWQFGELGYDYSINHCPDGTVNPDCRTANKPIRWDYYDVPERQRLFKVYGALNKLKIDNEAFSSSDFTWDVAGFGKRLIIEHPSMDVVVIANFSISPISMVPGFTQTGTWYDFFSGESIVENDLNNPFLLQPGEYRVYTDVELETPDLSVGVDDVGFSGGVLLGAYPNPFQGATQVSYFLNSAQNVSIRIFDLQGRMVDSVTPGLQPAGQHSIEWTPSHGDAIANGIYFMQLNTDGGSASIKVSYTR